MTLWKMIFPRWKDLPPVTMLLALSCLVISIPLLLWPLLYSILGFNDGTVNYFWQAITSSFAHGVPGSSTPAPFPHLVGNVLVIVLLGGLSERALGSGRFFVLTLATLTTHTIWKIWYGGGNGASGFCWGYVVIAAPIFFWEWQRRKKQVFKDPLYLFLVAFSAFMVFGVAAVMSILGFGWWNGTNQAHVFSVLTALPFVWLWRSLLHENWQRLQNDSPINRGRPLLNNAALGASILILVFNLTFAAIGVGALATGSLSEPQVVNIIPQNGELEALNEYERQVTLRFDRPMQAEVQMEWVSITWLDQVGKLDYAFHWEDTQTLVFVFSRDVYKGESVLIHGNVRAIRWNMAARFEIEYQ